MSSLNWNTTRRRSHSCREKPSRATSELYHQTTERIQHRFEEELARNERQLQRIQNLQDDSSSTTANYLENYRVKLRRSYNQLIQDNMEEIEKYMNYRCEEQRRLSERKLRKLRMKNENYRLHTIDHVVNQQNAICQEKLAAQRSFFNRLLQEQERRLRAEQSLQSFESLNIDQLKDRLTGVEQTNRQLKQLLEGFLANSDTIMSVKSATVKNKKKFVNLNSKLNQLENVQPVEVKCFINENKITIETNHKQPADATATMMTIIPQTKRVTSTPTKTQTVTKITNVVVAKPFRRLAILPSKKLPSKEVIHKPTVNLSETFTVDDDSTTAKTLVSSEDDIIQINNQIQVPTSSCQIATDMESKLDSMHVCDNTTVSSVCELVDEAKLQKKPHSLIGLYKKSNPIITSEPNPPTYVSAIHYDDVQTSEVPDKQMLIQQFYAQLEKMKATFNINEFGSSMTTGTIPDGVDQARPSSYFNQPKENATMTNESDTKVQQANKSKPPQVPKKQIIARKSLCRIQSAPNTMFPKKGTDKNRKQSSTPASKPKVHNERVSNQQQQQKPSDTSDKESRRTESAPANHIDIRAPEVTLLPQDEQECQKIFEKLQRLQPNGVCVDINTLRRALYPPVRTVAYPPTPSGIDQTSTPKSYRPRAEEIPQSWMKSDHQYASIYALKQAQLQMKHNETNASNASESPSIDRIADQVKKHAAINYSYYTRTK